MFMSYDFSIKAYGCKSVVMLNPKIKQLKII